MKFSCSIRLVLLGLAGLLLSPVPARANIFASNIKLNDQAHPTVVVSGRNLSVNYILNEPATAGVSVKIFSGTNLIRTLNLTNGQPGTLRGTNSVIWDGNDESAQVVTNGFYSASLTAATSGYDAWTQITDDTNTGNAVFEPRGIAVNQNTNSPYYGRVFVGNAPLFDGPDPSTMAGILKLNPDGSPADEGIFSTGGYYWSGGFYSPWKIEVSMDDKVYINDWSGNGMVMAFDQVLSTNFLTVLRGDNIPNGGLANLSGPFITGIGTNTQIWMADINTNTDLGGSTGITRWQVTSDGTLATNDLGTQIIPITASNLTAAPYDVAVDASGHIYTIQRRDTSGDPENRVFRFPAYNESGLPETNMDWAVGSGDDTLANAYGISVDPTGTYVAVASRGYGPNSSSLQGGGISILAATNGSLVTNIISEVDDQHTDTAWDAVGNLYETDNTAGVWRTYSPPGSNQATTISPFLIQVVNAYTVPTLGPLLLSDTNLLTTLSGQSNVTYAIQASTNLIDWNPIATNYSASASRAIDLPIDGDMQFFRAVVLP